MSGGSRKPVLTGSCPRGWSHATHWARCAEFTKRSCRSSREFRGLTTELPGNNSVEFHTSRGGTAPPPPIQKHGAGARIARVTSGERSGILKAREADG